MGVDVGLAFGLSALMIMHAVMVKTDDRKTQIIAGLVGTFVAGFCMVDVSGV